MKTILWVEDDYDRLKGMMRPLEKLGFKIYFAEDYPTYKKRTAKRVYDLYVVDLILPQKDERQTVSDDEYLSMPGIMIVKELNSLNKPIVVLSVVSDLKIIKELEDLENVKQIMAKGNIFPSDFKEDVLKIMGIENE